MMFTPTETGLRLADGARFWCITKDGDPHGLALFERHYSAHKYRDGRIRKIFCGPGEKLVLITPPGDALFVWRRFQDDSGQTGVNCAVFRNESPHRSSEMILEAMLLAWQRWPLARLYTYVNPRAIQSKNPGYCFKAAGWKQIGITKWNKLIILAYPE